MPLTTPYPKLALVVFITGFWGPIILVPLVMALFGIVVSAKMMVLSSISSTTAFLLWEHFSLQYFYFKGVFVGTMTSLLVFGWGVIRKR